MLKCVLCVLCVVLCVHEMNNTAAGRGFAPPSLPSKQRKMFTDGAIVAVLKVCDVRRANVYGIWL